MNPNDIVNFFRHFDQWLAQTVAQYGTTTYAILFAIIFAETGLVILPFLPGDSLLFAVGAFSAREEAGLNVWVLFPLLVAAALLGDNVNYWVGRSLGRRLFSKESSRIFKRSNLARTEAFFEKYGGKAIVMARFVPIVRTFAPFVAGMGRMAYPRFLAFSVGGAVLWVGVCLAAGHYFGGMEFVKKRFEVVVLGIIAVSLVPILVEYLNHRRAVKPPLPPNNGGGLKKPPR